MSYFVTSQTPIGTVQNDNTKQIVKYHFEVDTLQDLPTKNQFQSSGIIIAMTSTAHVIQTNNNYEMDSSGTWIRQKSNSNIMLDAENVIYDNTDSGLSSEDVQGAIDELKSNDDMQDRALAELYAENTSQQDEINYAINTGAKNLLPMTHTSGSITRYGVTCTWNAYDGTMTLNGAHSSGDSSAIFEFYDGSAGDTKMLPAGSYVLTGCPAGGSTSTYRAALTQIAGAVDAGNGANFELSEPHYAAYRIIISGNVTFNNMVFKPMVRLASITDNTFVTYAPTNRELYETCETKVTMQQIYGIPPVLIIPAEGETTDLNVYVTPGTYLVSTSNIASRIINAPFTDKGYKIEVEQYRSGTYYKQTIFPWAEPGAFYIRTRGGGATWSPWYKFEGTEVT